MSEYECMKLVVIVISSVVGCFIGAWMATR